jgi:hypothetical protein
MPQRLDNFIENLFRDGGARRPWCPAGESGKGRDFALAFVGGSVPTIAAGARAERDLDGGQQQQRGLTRE